MFEVFCVIKCTSIITGTFIQRSPPTGAALLFVSAQALIIPKLDSPTKPGRPCLAYWQVDDGHFT